MRALVIGGTGFIGRAIAGRLLARGLGVKATRRPTSNTLLLRKLPVEQVTLTLEDRGALEQAMAGCDVVFFAAGHYPRTSLDLAREVSIARRGAASVAAAARAAGVSRLVVTASVATAGTSAPPPGSVYHAVKHAIDEAIEAETAEAAAAVRPRAPGMRPGEAPVVVTIHGGGCLGEGDVKAATGFLVVGLATGALRTYVEGRLAFLDVDDLAEAHVRAALHPSPRRRYVLAGHEVNVSELLDAIARELGVSPSARPVDLEAAAEEALRQERSWVARQGPRPSLPREWIDIVRHWHPVSSALALAELDLVLTDLTTTIRRACAWYRRHGYIRAHEGSNA